MVGVALSYGKHEGAHLCYVTAVTAQTLHTLQLNLFQEQNSVLLLNTELQGFPNSPQRDCSRTQALLLAG